MSDLAEIVVMSSIAQIAQRDAVSKAAVSKAVKKLLENRPETPVERGAQGQVMRLSLAHYDHWRERFVNPAKATAPLRVFSPANGRPVAPEESFEEARRQAEWIKVGREQLRHQVDSGLLVDKAEVEARLVAAGREIQAAIGRLHNHADSLALAVSKAGSDGCRITMVEISHGLFDEILGYLSKVYWRAANSRVAGAGF